MIEDRNGGDEEVGEEGKLSLIWYNYMQNYEYVYMGRWMPKNCIERWTEIIVAVT